MKRLWSVRINVDGFNAALVGMDTDQERLAFLAGLSAGINGRPDQSRSVAWSEGWRVGNEGYSEAMAFSDRQREKGRKAHHRPAGAEPGLSRGTAGAEPISKYPNIQISNDPNIHQPPANDPFTGFTDPDIVTHEAWRYEAVQSWARDLKESGAKIGKGNWQAWKKLTATHGLATVIEAVAEVAPDARWPDQTEILLKSMGSQVKTSQAAVAARTTKVEI